MYSINWGLGIGDWGLGIGDWAQSPIPNPQSPIPIWCLKDNLCVKGSYGNFLYDFSGKSICLRECPNNSFNPYTYKCSTKLSKRLLTLCPNNQCEENGNCVNPESNKIAPGDGGLCVLKCSEGKCHKNFICITPDSTGKAQDLTGGICVEFCNANQCYNESFVCIPLSIDNKRQTIQSSQEFPIDDKCTKFCSQTRCYNSDFICIDSSKFNKRSVSLDSQNFSSDDSCVSFCDDNKCFNKLTFECIILSIENKRKMSQSLQSNEEDDQCLIYCNYIMHGISRCFNSNTYICVNASINNKLKNHDAAYYTNDFSPSDDECVEYCRMEDCFIENYKNSCFNNKWGSYFRSNQQNNDICRNWRYCHENNTCGSSDNNVCITPNITNKITDNNPYCMTFCDENRCSDSNFNCILLSNLNKRKTTNLLQISADDDKCVSFCSANNCFNSNFICEEPKYSYTRKMSEMDQINPNDDQCISLIRPCNMNQCFDTNKLQCVTVSIFMKRKTNNNLYLNSEECVNYCDIKDCFDQNYHCINANSNNLRRTKQNDFYNSDECVSKCDYDHCYKNNYYDTIKQVTINDDYSCYNKSINKIRKSINNHECTEYCYNENYPNNLGGYFTCINKDFVCIPQSEQNKGKPNGFSNPEKNICVKTCELNECYDIFSENNYTGHLCQSTISINYKRESIDSEKCVKFCKFDECLGNDNICKKLSVNNKKLSPINQLSSWSLFVDIKPECYSKCSNSDNVSLCNNTNFVCTYDSLEQKYEPRYYFDISSFIYCYDFCRDNKCYDDNFICIDSNQNNRKPQQIVNANHDKCIEYIPCEQNKCFDYNTLTCIETSLINKRRTNNNDIKYFDECVLKCESNQCFDNNFNCIDTTIYNKRSSNLNLDSSSDKCVSYCESNKCYISYSFYCIDTNIYNKRKTEIDEDNNNTSDQCVYNCEDNKCSHNNICIRLVKINKKRARYYSNELCLDFCNYNECYDSNNLCISTSNYNKRKKSTNIDHTDDQCVNNCDLNLCYNNDYICIETSINLKRRSNKNLDYFDDQCVNNCGLNLCYNINYICVGPSINAKRLSNNFDLNSDECVNNCSPNSCYNDLFICINTSIDTKRRSLENFETSDKCVKFCSQDKCHDSNFVCRDLSLNNKRKSNNNLEKNDDQCVANCQLDECFINDMFICNSTHFFNLKRKSNLNYNSTSDLCINYCGENECYNTNMICIQTSLNSKRNTEIVVLSNNYNDCLTNCPELGCSIVNKNFNCIYQLSNNVKRLATILEINSSIDRCVNFCSNLNCSNQNNICINLNNDNKRKKSSIMQINQDDDSCISTCPTNQCYDTNKICTNLSLNYLRKRNVNDECVTECLQDQCIINNVCSLTTECITYCGESNCEKICKDNECFNTKTKSCELLGIRNKKQLSQECAESCTINECDPNDGSFKCINISNTLKRISDIILDDICINFCPPNKCSQSNVCVSLDITKKRKSNINSDFVNSGDICVSTCESNYCYDQLLNTCLVTSNIIGLRKLRTSDIDEICTSSCQYNQCINSKNTCIEVNENSKKMTNQLCNNSCPINECNLNNSNICTQLSVKNKRVSEILNEDECTFFCDLNKCSNMNVCTIMDSNKRRKSNINFDFNNTGDSCVDVCDSKYCFNNIDKICVVSSSTSFPLRLRTSLTDDVCINECGSNECINLNNTCVIVGEGNKRSLNNECSSICGLNECDYNNSFICVKTTINLKRMSTNSDDSCSQFCTSKTCANSNICIPLDNLNKRKSILNNDFSNTGDFCVSLCEQNYCYDETNNSCVSTSSIGQFKLRTSEINDLCIQKCNLNECIDSNNVCKVIGPNITKSSNDQCEYLYFCPENKCLDNLNNCIDIPPLYKKSINHMCVSHCSLKECNPSGSNICVSISNLNKRVSSEITSDICVNYCDNDKCLYSNVCNQISNEKKRKSINNSDFSYTGDHCVVNCDLNYCRDKNTFICRLTSILQEPIVLRKSLEIDECTTLCNTNECFDNNNICSLTNQNNKKLLDGKCGTFCDSNTCYTNDLSFVCKSLNNSSNKRRSNINSDFNNTGDQCIIICDENYCRNDEENICRSTSTMIESLTFRTSIDDDKCSFNCKENECLNTTLKKCELLGVRNKRKLSHECAESCAINECDPNDGTFKCINKSNEFKRNSDLILDDLCTNFCPPNKCSHNNVCVLLDLTKKRKSNINSDFVNSGDICVSNCELNYCFDQLLNTCFVTSNIISFRKLRTSDIDEICTSSCQYNQCINSKNTCIEVNENSKKMTNQLCNNSCPINECNLNNSNICTQLSVKNKRVSEILNEDECTFFCDLNKCSNMNVCTIMDSNKRRKSNINFDFNNTGDSCVDVCDSKYCFNNIDKICVVSSSTSFPLRLRTSLTDDVCINECGSNECINLNNTCVIVGEGNKRSLNNECSSICGLNECDYNNSFICVKTTINLKRMSTNSDDSCSQFCTSKTCANSNICIPLDNLNKRKSILNNDFSNTGDFCVSLCEQNYCYDQTNNSCVSTASIGQFKLRTSEINDICIQKCNLNECIDSNNVCKVIGPNITKSSNDQCEYLYFCPENKCLDNLNNCIDIPPLYKKSLNHMCVSHCSLKECNPSGSNICVSISNLNKRVSSEITSDICVNYCDNDKCLYSNVCNQISNEKKRKSINNSDFSYTGDHCVVNCDLNYCRDKNTFICRLTSILQEPIVLRKSLEIDECTTLCNTNECFDNNNICSLTNQNNKKLLDGKCGTFCDLNTCYTNDLSFVCKSLNNSSNKRRSNINSDFNNTGDQCIITCNENYCRNEEENICRSTSTMIESLTFRTSIDDDKCSFNCKENECLNTTSKKCELLGVRNKRKLSHECAESCAINECDPNDGTFTCINKSNEFKRNSDLILDDLCTNFCPPNKCSHNNVCVLLDLTKKRKSNINSDFVYSGDICVSACESNYCFDQLLNTCFETSNLQIDQKFRTSLTDDTCKKNCNSNECYNSNNICVDISLGNVKKLNNKCGLFCDDINECQSYKSAFICEEANSNNCLVKCKSSQCIQNNKCVTSTYNNLASLNGGFCINSSRCPSNQCSLNNNCISPDFSYKLSDLIGGKCINTNDENTILDYNYKNEIYSKNKLDFHFNTQILENINITNKNSFNIKFSNGSVKSNTEAKCEIVIDGITIKTIELERDSLESYFCIIENRSLNLKLVKNISITLYGIQFSSNFIGYTTIAIYSKRFNGIRISQIFSFYNYSVYDQYDKADKIFNITDVNITNVNNNNCLEQPCRTLYPWSDFTISTDIEVNRYINLDEIKICFVFFVINKPLFLKVVSEPFSATDVLHSQLGANNSEGLKLYLNNNETGEYCLDNIAKYIQTGEYKIFQLFSSDRIKRKFKLIFSGFNTGKKVSVIGFSKMNSIIYWKNTPSILSFSSFTKIVRIETLKFINASSNPSLSSVNYSVTNNEDENENALFSNHFYNLKFAIKIPKINSSGILTIRHVYLNSSDRVGMVSFINSTCDFSENSNLSNIYGVRPLCIPQNQDQNSLKKESFDSEINIKIKNKNDSQDIVFSIWSFIKCLNNLNNSNDYNIRFEYYFNIDGITYIQSNVNSRLFFSGLQNNPMIYKWNFADFELSKSTLSNIYNQTNLTTNLQNIDNLNYSDIKNTNLGILIEDDKLNIDSNNSGVTSILRFPVKYSSLSPIFKNCGLVSITNQIKYFNSNSNERNIIITSNSNNFELKSNKNYIDDYSSSLRKFIGTNCINLKTYDSLSIKNIYSSLSFFIEHYNIQGKLVQKNRFFKMLNFSNGFRKNNLVKIDENSLVSYSVPNENNTRVNLCILEIKQNVVNELNNSSNLLLVTLLESYLPNFGIEDEDTYPISKLSNGVNAYPLYSEPLCGDLIECNFNNENLLFNYFGGPSIAIFGFKKKNLNQINSTNKSIFLPISCGITNNNKAIIQAFNISGSLEIDKSTNIIYEPHGNSTFNTNPMIRTVSNLNNAKISLKYYENNFTPNEIKIDNNMGINSFRNLFILTNLDETNIPNSKILMENSFLTLNKQINFNGKKLNGYFIVEETLMPEKINFFKISNENSGMILNFYGYSIIQSNELNFSNTLQLVPVLKEEINENLNNFDATFMIDLVSIGKLYTKDNAINMIINCKLTVNQVTNGNINLYSNSFIKNHTVCKNRNLNYCDVDDNKLTCLNLSFKKGENIINIDCFNLRFTNDNYVTFLNNSTVEFSNSKNVLLTYEGNTREFNLTSLIKGSNISDIVPSIVKVCSNHSHNQNSMGYFDFVLNLGRSYRLGQTIRVSSNIDLFFLNETSILCSFIVKDNYNCDSDSFIINDYVYGKSCKITKIGNNNTEIILTSNMDILTDIETELPSEIILRLTPLLIKDLSLLKVSINTYINQSVDLPISINTISQEILSTKAYSLSSKEIIPSIINSLLDPICTIKSIFPEFVNLSGEFTFELKLKDIDLKLNEINKTLSNSAKLKVVNEISIFMDPSIYNINPNIRCYFENLEASCEWKDYNFININWEKSLVNGVYKIVIEGINVPHLYYNEILKTTNSHFYCSFNNYDNDSSKRENILIGNGVSQVETLNISSLSNLIYLRSEETFQISTNPREKTDYNLNFFIEFNKNLSTVNVNNSSIDYKSRYLIVIFPYSILKDEFNNSKAELNIFTKDFQYTDNSKSTLIDKLKIDLKLEMSSGPGILKIDLPSEFDSLQNVEFYQLKLQNIPSAKDSGMYKKIEIIFCRVDKNNISEIFTTIFSTNQSNKQSNLESLEINQPKFMFSNLKNLIEISDTNLRILPGRYYPLTFTITGQNLNYETEITLNHKSIKLLDSLKLNTGLNKANNGMIGTSCKSLFGTYILNFSSSEKNKVHNLPTVFVKILERKDNNREIIYLSSTTNAQNDESTFKISIGGISYINMFTSKIPFESVIYDFVTSKGKINDISFKLNQAELNSNNLVGLYKRIAFEITNSTEENQYIDIYTDNKCYSFGNTRQNSKTLTFKIEDTIVKLDNIDLKNKFRYVQTNDLSKIIVKYLTPIKFTKTYIALVCTNINSDDITPDVIYNKLGKDDLISKYKFLLHNEDKNEIEIVFDNLQRGTSYKLVVYISNQSIVPTVTKEILSQISSGSNNAILKTAPKSENSIIQLKSNILISEENEKLIMIKMQEFLKTYSVIVFNNNGPLKGFENTNFIKCTNSTINKISSKEKRKSRTKSRTNDGIPRDLLTFVLAENPSSNLEINLNKITSNLLELVNSQEKMTAFLGVNLNANIEFRNIEEIPYDKDKIELRNFTYNNSHLEFYPISDRKEVCSYLILKELNNNEKNSTSINLPNNMSSTVVTEDDFYNCLSNCGEIEFDTNIKSNKTELAIDKLLNGTYFIMILCKSEIPLSENRIILKNTDPIIIDSQSNNTSNTNNTNNTISDPIEITNSSETSLSPLHLINSMFTLVLLFSLIF
jgi:hypothetical protein